MKPSVIIALIVGGVVGFAVGNMFQKPSEGGAPTPVAAAPTPGAPAAPRPQGAPPSDTTVYKVPLENSPVKGPNTALVTIVEFSDYQCPFCVRAEPTVKEVLAAYPGKVRLVHRDYPLPSHGLAPKAAEAAHCAGDQQKYWEMHDRLYAANGKLELAELKSYAREVGVEGAKFDKCLESGEKATLVAFHQKAGEAAGVTGTPAFFVNGRLISGAQPLDAFKAVIDQELKGGAKQ